MPRRKKPSEIYLAWDKIVSGDDKYSPESQQAWDALWQQHCGGDGLTETPIGDVFLLCSLGYEQAAYQADWLAARKRIERYFQHTQWQTDEPIHLLMSEASLSRALWECREENSALESWINLIRQPGKNNKLACLLVLHELLGICLSMPETIHARTLFSGVVREVVEKLTKRKLPPMSAPAVENWQGFTYSELAAVLESARTARTKPT
nr:hypothetical protein [Armatimonas sp.]